MARLAWEWGFTLSQVTRVSAFGACETEGGKGLYLRRTPTPGNGKEPKGKTEEGACFFSGEKGGKEEGRRNWWLRRNFQDSFLG